MAEELKYLPVDIETLKVGMLVERSLYVYLPENQRYILLVQPLHPLEERALAKMRRIKQVFSGDQALDVQFPKLDESARTVRELCDDADLAPFEKNKFIRTTTDWLVQQVFQPRQGAMAPVYFFHRAFGVPRTETLIFVSDLSVVLYERSLVLAAVSGILALWLGYSDTTFLRQFVEAVFCQEIGLFHQNESADPNAMLSDSQRETSLKMISSGEVPGVGEMDQRFRMLLSSRSKCHVAGDELYGIMEFARWVSNASTSHTGEARPSSRVARKLELQFGLSVDDQREVAA